MIFWKGIGNRFGRECMVLGRCPRHKSVSGFGAPAALMSTSHGNSYVYEGLPCPLCRGECGHKSVAG